MKIEILLENDDYIIINKPAGLMVHGDGRKNETTLVDMLLEAYPEIKGVGERMLAGDKTMERPGIVHRLDQETSGALLVAKNQEAFEYFKVQFKDRNVTKEYHAFVWGQFKEKTGIVDEPIGRNKNDFRRRHAGRGIRGEAKEAITKWEMVNQFEDEKREQFSFVHLFPKTGRTHQLRVHMNFLQRPIVSDTLYAPSKIKALGFSRLALHARRISFTDQKGESIEVEAPYPEDFKEALARYV